MICFIISASPAASAAAGHLAGPLLLTRVAGGADQCLRALSLDNVSSFKLVDLRIGDEVIGYVRRLLSTFLL